jgi:hypothetical protein
VEPDLRQFQRTQKATYDVLLLTYDTPFKDLTINFEVAKFGDAVKVEFGPYALHKKVKAGRDPWFLRAPFTGETDLDVEKLFSELETSQDRDRTLKSFGVQPDVA